MSRVYVRQTGGMRKWIALGLLVLATGGFGVWKLVPRPRTFTVTARSMSPTLVPGDRVGCSSRVPGTVRRGSVVAHHGWDDPPAGRKAPSFLQRVVAVGGETIEIGRDQVVRVNGAPLVEPYKAPDELGAPPPLPPVTVPPGHYFLLGDNRGQSLDSRFQGTLPHDRVIAVCTRILAPGGRRGRIQGT